MPGLWRFAGLGLLAALPTSALNRNLSRRYRTARKEERLGQKSDQPLISEADIAALPPPAQRYMRAAGIIGRRRTSSVLVIFDAELRECGDDTAMR